MEKAVLISVDFENNKVSHDFFEGDNAYMKAWSFRESIQDDFGDSRTFRIIKFNAETVVLDQEERPDKFCERLDLPKKKVLNFMGEEYELT